MNLRSVPAPPSAATYDLGTTSAYSQCKCSQEGSQRRTPVERHGAPADHRIRQVRRQRDETATERERTRARQLNDAFDRLRRVVPTSAHDERRRLSKIATLRLAVNYIGALTTLLGHRKASAFSDDNDETVATLVRTSQPNQI